MSATTITPVSLTRSGVVVAPVGSDVNNGNQIPLTGFEQVEIINGDSVTRTVTFVCQSKNSRGQANPNIVAPVAAATTLVFGPFQKADWADANSNLQLTWSAGTSSTLTTVRASKNLVSNPSSDTEGSL
jgi:hypothetical protein